MSLLSQNSKTGLINTNSKNKKRITGLKTTPVVESKDKMIEGVLISDKVGEVRFVNIENLIKKQKGSHIEVDDLGTTLFGH